MFFRTTYKFLLLISFIFNLAEGQRRVYEGDDLRYDVHSYLVKLEITEPNVEVECSGSIISPNWIITAAHCIEADLIKVNVIHGVEADLIAEVDKHDAQIHPEYCSIKHNVRHDIALLYIRQKIQFNENIKPIELVTSEPDVDEPGIIAGYGETECGVEAPREASVIIKRCSFNNANMMCSFSAGRGGEGDSGGPLVHNGRLAGIMTMIAKSHRMCFTYYASVAENVKWIQSVINGTLYVL